MKGACPNESSRILVMDGAMGTELYQAGLEEGECGEEWNLSRADRVRAIHQSYLTAGAQCLLTNTFQANPCALVKHGLEDRLLEINHAALRAASLVAPAEVMILGSIGPIHIEGLDTEFPEWDDLKETAQSFLDAMMIYRLRLDGLMLETCSSARALSAVAYLKHKVLGEEMPVYLSIAYQNEGGKLISHSGQKPESFARHAASHDISALGANCGRDIGLDEMLEIVKRYRDETDLPIFVRPNAGTPKQIDGQWRYPLTPEQFGERAFDFFEAGVSMIGGCCGTTPAHIAALKASLEEYSR